MQRKISLFFAKIVFISFQLAKKAYFCIFNLFFGNKRTQFMAIFTRMLILFALFYFLSAYSLQAQHKWKAQDTLFVMYPNGCQFYKWPDTKAEKYFTFVRSSKVILLDTRPQSALIQVDGVWGYLRLVRWESYIGYAFDGFLTSLYVCKFENCRNIADALDWYNIREFSQETLLDCRPNELEITLLDKQLAPSCDSVEIWWKMGVRYRAYRSPTQYSETFSVPFATVQEVLLWSKLLYKELFNANLQSPSEKIETEKEGEIIKQKFNYKYDPENKLNYFTLDYKSYEKESNRLLSDFYMEIRNAGKKIEVTIERNYHNQIVIKSN